MTVSGSEASEPNAMMTVDRTFEVGVRYASATVADAFAAASRHRHGTALADLTTTVGWKASMSLADAVSSTAGPRASATVADAFAAASRHRHGTAHADLATTVVWKASTSLADALIATGATAHLADAFRAAGGKASTSLADAVSSTAGLRASASFVGTLIAAGETASGLAAKLLAASATSRLPYPFTDAGLRARPGEPAAMSVPAGATASRETSWPAGPIDGVPAAGGWGEVAAQVATELRSWLVRPGVKGMGIMVAIYLFGAWYVSFRAHYPRFAHEVDGLILGTFFLLLERWAAAGRDLR